MKFKVGNKLKPVDNNWSPCGSCDGEGAEYILITEVENSRYLYDAYNKKGDHVAHCNGCFNDKNLIPYKKKIMKNNKTTKKALYKVGDIIRNDDNDQKSKVLFVVYDIENQEYVYTLQCQEDSGSIHNENEEMLSIIEKEELTIQELVEYYEENESVEVKITK